MSMAQVLKIFADKQGQASLAQTLPVLERYDGFILVEATSAQAKRLSREYLVEDVTSLYAIPTARGAIDTTGPRVEAGGAVRSHPAYRGASALPPGAHHYLVQFIGPIKDEWLDGVCGAGGEPREPHGNFVYVVRADETAVARIAALPYVRWMGHLPYEERLAEPVAGSIRGDAAPTLPRTRLLPDAYTVEFFGPDDVSGAAEEVRRLGLTILLEEPQARILVVEAAGQRAARARQLRALSAVHGVRKVRQRAVNRASNDVAAGIMATAVTMGSPGLGLSGKGEIVGVCDTGLDTGAPASIHRDFAGRIAAIRSYPITDDFAAFITNPGDDDGPADLDSGHGTHVSGSVLGDGSASGGIAGIAGPIRGCAHGAKLVFQAVEQRLDWKNPSFIQRYGRYLLAGIPADLKQLFADAYGQGARVHSNSWGGGDPGAYDEQCLALDEFVWQHKDFSVVVAAGNDGTDVDGDGKINPLSVSAPGTAKNCVTVGACENRRLAFSAQTYGQWWPRDYPAAPFNADPMANDPNQVVAFSSRGPTKDGRVKPDAVAPGTFILSTRSTMIAQNNTAWAGFPSSRLYFYMGGTSMATPLVAGAVTLLREYLRKRRRITAPSAALIKAALIAGTTRLGGYGATGAVLDNDQGYGRVALDAVVAPPAPASAQFRDVRPGLRTGEVCRRALTIKSDAVPLRIAMAYSDFPGPSLVNNLNLIVTAPDGRRLAGNQRAGAAPTLDVTNNAELIHVARPAAGSWQVEVVGSNVPNGPQDFAVVTLGHV
jgi:serine protease AprX